MAGKFTPGPWELRTRDFRGNESGFDFYVVGDVSEGEDGPCCVGIARVFGNATAGNIPLANARLISSAPALMAALEEVDVGLQCHMDEHDDHGGRLTALRRLILDALAKAAK